MDSSCDNGQLRLMTERHLRACAVGRFFDSGRNADDQGKLASSGKIVPPSVSCCRL